jgi:tRNA pseudouridine38-40 synthase
MDESSESSRSVLRVRLDLAYDGTAFSGWAAQPGLRTVQGELATALATVLRCSDPVQLTVAGRTDAGVHARGQVVHVDVDPDAWAALPGRSDRPPGVALVSRLAGVLPPDVVVRRAEPAPAGFDARFSALERRYVYRLADDGAERDPLRRHDTVWWRRPLDVDAMDVAARSLVGLRDFAAFCKQREGATTVRTLLDYSWTRLPDGVAVATVRADAFCHSMVRSLVGAVVPVGEGRRARDWPRDLQERAVRAPEIHVMPAHGLSLEEVVYPPEADLAGRAVATRARRDHA